MPPDQQDRPPVPEQRAYGCPTCALDRLPLTAGDGTCALCGDLRPRPLPTEARR
jgi:hypothetical protein